MTNRKDAAKYDDCLAELERLVREDLVRDPDHSRYFSAEFRALAVDCMTAGIPASTIEDMSGVSMASLIAWKRSARRESNNAERCTDSSEFRALPVVSSRNLLAQKDTVQVNSLDVEYVFSVSKKITVKTSVTGLTQSFAQFLKTLEAT